MASASKHQNPSTTTPKTPIALDPTTTTLSRASHLTRQELLRRRSHHLKQLSKCYRAHYWALMDQLKLQYKHYYWKFGVSPFQQDAAESNERDIQTQAANSEACDNNNNNYNNQRCVFVACKQKAMPLTSFCHLHILSDSKQKLYKPCTYVTRSNHFQKAQKHVTRTLKQAGRNVSSSSKLAPKFHVIVAEYVRQIQAKRRSAKRANRSKVVVKEEIAG